MQHLSFLVNFTNFPSVACIWSCQGWTSHTCTSCMSVRTRNVTTLHRFVTTIQCVPVWSTNFYKNSSLFGYYDIRIGAQFVGYLPTMNRLQTSEGGLSTVVVVYACVFTMVWVWVRNPLEAVTVCVLQWMWPIACCMSNRLNGDSYRVSRGLCFECAYKDQWNIPETKSSYIRACSFILYVTDRLFHTPYIREARVIFFSLNFQWQTRLSSDFHQSNSKVTKLSRQEIASHSSSSTRVRSSVWKGQHSTLLTINWLQTPPKVKHSNLEPGQLSTVTRNGLNDRGSIPGTGTEIYLPPRRNRSSTASKQPSAQHVPAWS
jgi:hypothetical protein